MNLLALDTSSLACSVAVQRGDRVFERHEEEARAHTRLLVPMIRAVLEEASTAVNELEAIVLGNGPGSFIGMRIAASVAQGLAHGAGIQIVPVSSLAAVAAEAFAHSDAERAVVAQDAHMNEVYLGLFTRGDDDVPEPAAAERLHGQGAIAELAEPGFRDVIAAGGGWQRYPELLSANRPRLPALSESLYPRASYLLPLGTRALQASGACDPAALVPAYLRQKVAEKPAGPS